MFSQNKSKPNFSFIIDIVLEFLPSVIPNISVSLIREGLVGKNKVTAFIVWISLFNYCSDI